jgi:hypothetical protein
MASTDIHPLNTTAELLASYEFYYNLQNNRLGAVLQAIELFIQKRLERDDSFQASLKKFNADEADSLKRPSTTTTASSTTVSSTTVTSTAHGLFTDHYSLISFSSTARVEFNHKSVGLATDIREVEQYNTLKADGNTDYLSALTVLKQEVNLASDPHAHIRYEVIFLSDGENNRRSDKHLILRHIDELVRREHELKDPISYFTLHTVLFGGDVSGAELLQEMAEIGKGTYTHCRNMHSLVTAFANHAGQVYLGTDSK